MVNAMDLWKKRLYYTKTIEVFQAIWSFRTLICYGKTMKLWKELWYYGKTIDGWLDGWLVVWSLSSHSRVFHSYVDVTIAGEGLHILTYGNHLWTLSSESSLTLHTHCDTGLPFIMVISENPWHSHLMPCVWQWVELSLPVSTT